MIERIVIVGAFHEIIDLAQECGYEIVGLVDAAGPAGAFPYLWLGDDAAITANPGLLASAAVVITPDAPGIRQRLYRRYAGLGCRMASLVAPGARVSGSVRLGAGVVIQWGAHISAECHIGHGVRLNVGANVMHDVVIGDFTTIAPNAVVLGRVRIGAACYIGANATLLPGVVVGAGAVIGAGAVVTRDVPQDFIMVGNPARVLRHNKTEPSLPNAQ